MAPDLAGLPAETEVQIKGRRAGKAISFRTVERWRHDGLLRGGIRIRLRAIRLGTTFETMRYGLKFYSSAASTHTALDALRNIQQKRSFKPEFGEASVHVPRFHIDRFW